MPQNSNISSLEVTKTGSEIEEKNKEVTPEVSGKPTPRAIDYVWTIFIFLAFAIIACWYALIYSAWLQQRDSSRFHFSRFGLKNQKEVEEAFNAYDFPKLTSYWIPLASAGVHRLYYEQGMKYL